MTEAITLTRYISLIQGQQILVFSSFVRTVSLFLMTLFCLLLV
jgi:hypothetical protein